MSTDNSVKTANTGGRKRDAMRDTAILKATIDVLAEQGYAGLTMDAVASRAGASKATVYRRWDSKTALIRDAMLKMQEAPGAPDSLPNTGNLRDDLMALLVIEPVAEANRRLRVMLGLISVLTHDASISEIGDTSIVTPWSAACRHLIERALARGEVTAAGVDIEMLSRVVPAMAVSRVLLQRQIADRDFIASLVDGVLMPALKSTAGQ